MPESINLIAKALIVLTFIINIFLASIIIIHKPRRKANTVFGLLVFIVAFWNLTHIALHTGIRYFFGNQHLLILEKLTMPPAILIPIFTLYFVVLFSRKIEIVKWKLAVLFLIPLTLLLFTPFNYYFSEAWVTGWGSSFKVGPLYSLFGIYFLCYILMSMVVLVKEHKNTTNRIRKLQIRYIIWGISLATILGIVFNVLSPLLDKNEFVVFGVPVTLIFSGLVSYAILRHRFLDIKIILKRGLVHSLLLIIILGVVSFSILFLGGLFQSLFQFSYIITASICAFIIALIFQPLKKALYKLLDNFYYKRKTAQEVRREIDNLLKKNTDLPKMFKKLADVIRSDISTQKFCFLAYNAKDKKYTADFSTVNKKIEIPIEEYFVSVLKRENKIYIKDEIPLIKDNAENEEEVEHLDRIEKKLIEIDMQLVIPLIAGDEMVAIFFLGNKKGDKIYSVEDIKYLNEFTKQASFYIANVLLYKWAVERALRRK